MKPKVSIMILT